MSRNSLKYNIKYSYEIVNKYSNKIHRYTWKKKNFFLVKIVFMKYKGIFFYNSNL